MSANTNNKGVLAAVGGAAGGGSTADRRRVRILLHRAVLPLLLFLCYASRGVSVFLPNFLGPSTVTWPAFPALHLCHPSPYLAEFIIGASECG